MKKVLLIQPAMHSLEKLEEIMDGRTPLKHDRGTYTFPLGILHIGSLLEKHCHEVNILDLDKEFYVFLHDNTKERDIDSFLDRYLVNYVASYGPDIIGISANFNCNKDFVALCCEKLKRFNEDILIVLGGHYPTNCYEDILKRDSCVDHIILGEGEEVMLQLVEAYRKSNLQYIEDHTNIVSKDNVASGVHKIKGAALVDDIEVLPSINYELLDTAIEYVTHSANIRIIFPRGVKTRAVVMMTSRGCASRCTYCASHKVHGRKIRAFSVDRIVNEIEQLVEGYDINALIFEDDLFTFNRKRTVELSRKIYEKFGDRFFIEFSNGIAVATLNEECIYWMAKAGMKQIHLAIESGNQYVQDEIIKKRLNLSKVKPVVELLKKYDVNIRAFFIMGFPGETLDMMRDTGRFAKELKVDWAVFSFASPVVGSELYESTKKNGQLISSNSDATTYLDAQIRSDDWTHEDVMRIQEEINYEVNFLENYNLVEGNYEKCIYIFSNICSDYPNHLIAHYCLWKAQIGIGNISEAIDMEKKIFNILACDKRSKSLAKKYGLSKLEPFTKFTTN